MNNTIASRIDEINPRLIAYSRFIDFNSKSDLGADDLLQEMYLSLLEKSANDPEFATQKDAYLYFFAVWMGKNAAAKSRTYAAHMEDLDTTRAEIQLSGSDYATADPARIIEDQEEIEELLSALQDLSIENQRVIKLVYLGYSTSEIADALSISAPAVSQRKRTIKKAIAG